MARVMMCFYLILIYNMKYSKMIGHVSDYNSRVKVGICVVRIYIWSIRVADIGVILVG